MFTSTYFVENPGELLLQIQVSFSYTFSQHFTTYQKWQIPFFSGLTLNAFFQWCVIRQSYSDFSDMFIYQIYYLIKYIYIYISISIYRER